ncbi:MAG: nucleotidyltransferase domain-containing protein [Patescibacteria group bacterium]|nr:nucleotidyltransferase domain-containing protein [Patescibacteria group bacterium]MBU1160710.1 nucleotidyltransferase domain-containing protein [Patescibacteria group bacterium]MBU1349818.1 nucleotidyltransferase domain-containing protein [Patescibacteria group bacterium]MBU1421483.1 nucleotidyltransferase domain-containing protein [Patescibacteria group bacterium]MBU1684616.1 nucleotidyltransferase domain-containing protein [Patescibacteria group bacterium]
MNQTFTKTEKQIRNIIFKHLDSKKYKVFLFGSRVNGQALKYSDYDIGIYGKSRLPSEDKFLIEESLEESDISCKVDIVDFSLVSPNFRKVALSKIKRYD